MVEYEIYDWLKSRKIETAEYKTFRIEEALDFASYPAVLKIASPKIIHKSEVGGVIANIEGIEKLNEAKKLMLSSLSQNKIELSNNDRFLVTKQYQGIELFFGIINDPVFEKVILFGAGGVYAELFRDICFIDSEADADEIKLAISKTKIATVFTKGFRGKMYDLNLIVEFIQKIQQLDADEMDLNPVILSENQLTVVDARILPQRSKGEKKSLKYQPGIFLPQKIAVIGVSDNISKVGYALAKNTCDNPNVYFVNPRLDTLLNKKIFRSIEDLPEVDTAVLAIPAASIRQAIEQLVPKRVKNIIIITAGFKESGNDEHFLSQLASEFQLNIIGPNCLGVYLKGINLSFGSSEIRTGNVNLFSQSGAIVAELMDKSVLKISGFENIISVGNMADIDFADLINSYSGNNPINIYVEGISNGKNFLRAIRNSKVAVNIFKAGISVAAQKAAFSHTGNMAGNYEMFMNLVKNAGAKIVRNVNGLLYAYQFKNILIVTNGGGSGTVLSDQIGDKLFSMSAEQIQQLDKVLPYQWSKNNPIDIIGDAGSSRYEEVLKVVDNFGADAMYVVITPQFMTEPEKIIDIFIRDGFKTKLFPVLLGGKMMEAAKNKLREQRIVFFEEIDEAAAFLY